MLFNNTLKKNLLLTLFLILGLTLFAACTSDSTSSNTNSNDANTNDANANENDGAMEEMEHQMEEGADMEHEDDGDRIPNPDGAAVTILSPEDGATFAQGDEVIVEVQVENFALGEDGSHWHVYVDGTSWGMVTGGNTTESLRGLEAGEHLIEVYIAGGDHIEFQDGDSIHITVE